MAASPLLAAAPARNRIRFLAIAIFALLLLLCGRAVQLAFSGDPLSVTREAAVAAPKRADIVDRNGVLLATTVRAFALTAAPSLVWDARETTDALLAIFPDLDRAATERRLADQSRRLVFLRRALSPDQRVQVLALGLAGIGFEAENRRDYPNGALGAHVLGFTDVDLKPLAGVERGLDARIRAAGAGQVRLSLDVRMQYALETELAAAAQAAGASGAAGILLDGRSGEVFALASWPSFDPNAAGQAAEAERRDRVAGDVHELGSTIKPFIVAMALQEARDELQRIVRPFPSSGHRRQRHRRPRTDRWTLSVCATSLRVRPISVRRGWRCVWAEPGSALTLSGSGLPRRRVCNSGATRPQSRQ